MSKNTGPVLKVNWKKAEQNFDSIIQRYDQYLRERGFSESTIERNTNILGYFLKFANDNRPSIAQANEYRSYLIKEKKAHSTVNNSCFAIKQME
jgi:hypothetical protein